MGVSRAGNGPQRAFHGLNQLEVMRSVGVVDRVEGDLLYAVGGEHGQLELEVRTPTEPEEIGELGNRGVEVFDDDAGVVQVLVADRRHVAWGAHRLLLLRARRRLRPNGYQVTACCS